jgi:hypothetical protein
MHWLGCSVISVDSVALLITVRLPYTRNSKQTYTPSTLYICKEPQIRNSCSLKTHSRRQLNCCINECKLRYLLSSFIVVATNHNKNSAVQLVGAAMFSQPVAAESSRVVWLVLAEAVDGSVINLQLHFAARITLTIFDYGTGHSF